MPLKKTTIYDRIIEVLGSPKQTQIAELLGVSEQAISHWKRKTTFPSLEIVAQVSDLTGASMHWLLMDEGANLLLSLGQLIKNGLQR